MTDENKPAQVGNGVVVSMDYKLTVDGDVVDSSEEHGPLEYLQGHGNIIPGLESEMAGMKIGDSKNVTVAPEDGYGDFDPDAIVDVDRGDFPPEIPVEIGVELQVADDHGHPMLATIVEIADDVVTLDTNHPLAGKELHFEVKVVDLRAATNEELSHGHVHSGDHHH